MMIKIDEEGKDVKMKERKKEQIKKAFDKFKTCKFSDGYWCYQKRKWFFGILLDKLFGIKKHNVGVNGFSIRNHCFNCKMYEKKRL